MAKSPRDLSAHEREEGLGRRMRRFVETELGRALDKGEPRAGTHSSNREDENQMGSAEIDQVHDPVDVGHDQVPEQDVRPEQPPEQPPEESAAAPRDHQATSAERVGLLNDTASLREQWRGIQSTFVDDPQQAVDEAGMLVDRTLDEIRTNVGSARPSESMSTEDLRMSFQRYREFFERLLSA